jgi:pimeloyl-ACP methyl ester carboxylesterase
MSRSWDWERSGLPHVEVFGDDVASHGLDHLAGTGDLLPRVAVPPLLVWGEQDVRSPLSVAREFEQAIPDAKLVVIPDCGHVSNLEQPELFSEAVREFCRAHATP